MTKKITMIIVVLTMMTFSLMTVQAQSVHDSCKCCTADIGKGEVIVNYAEGLELHIHFYYAKDNIFKDAEGNYKHGPLSEAVCYSWEQLKSDFQPISDTKVLIKFDWDKLNKFGWEPHGWTIKKHTDGKIFIGSYANESATQNQNVENIRIFDIKSDCYEGYGGQCYTDGTENPKKKMYMIIMNVFLTDK